MRNTFIAQLTEFAKQNPDAMLLTGDLGYNAFETFMQELPEQYLNVGVAEQSLISVAAGLALSGKKVFCYSISTFATMRAYEQIRNDIAYQNLPVVIIGGGSTFSYSVLGCTHFPMEDIAIMRALPNMHVLCPGDPHEVKQLMQQVCTLDAPVYMRTAKRGEPMVHPADTPITLGKAAMLQDGTDVTLAVSGRQLPFVMQAAEQLQKEHGMSVRVLSFHTIKPLDTQAILDAAKDTSGIVTIEEHLITGGFGSAVAEVLADATVNTTLKRIAVADEFPKGIGTQEYMLEQYGITIENMVAQALAIVQK